MKVCGVIVAGVVLVYLATGRGKQNSPFIPDAIEDQLDRVVEVLNRRFGHRWVNYALDSLERYLTWALPGPAALLSTVHWVEQNHGYLTGSAKKQLAVDTFGAWPHPPLNHQR